MGRKSNKQIDDGRKELFQKRFLQLCSDIESGEITEIKEEDYKTGVKGRIYQDYIKEPINENNFTMAFSNELDENDIFYRCRKELPVNWFVNRNGEVIEFNLENDNSEWTWKKSNKYTSEIRKGIEEKRIPKDGNRDVRLYEKQYYIRKVDRNREYVVKDGKTIMSYNLVGIIYNSRVLGEVAKNVIKDKGLDAFSNRGQEDITGHHIEGYIKDSEFKNTYEDNMNYNNNPDRILFMTNRVHRALYNLISTIEEKKEYEHFQDALNNTLILENPDKSFLINIHPKNEKDEPIPIQELENYNIVIKDVTKDRERITIFAKDIPYVDIEVISMEEGNKIANEYLLNRPDQIINLWLDVNGKTYDKNDIDITRVVKINLSEKISVLFNRNNEIKNFIVHYKSGNKDKYKEWINNLVNNTEHRNEIGNMIYDRFEKTGEYSKERRIKDSDVIVLTEMPQ